MDTIIKCPRGGKGLTKRECRYLADRKSLFFRKKSSPELVFLLCDPPIRDAGMFTFNRRRSKGRGEGGEGLG